MEVENVKIGNLGSLELNIPVLRYGESKPVVSFVFPCTEMKTQLFLLQRGFTI